MLLSAYQPATAFSSLMADSPLPLIDAACRFIFSGSLCIICNPILASGDLTGHWWGFFKVYFLIKRDTQDGLALSEPAPLIPYTHKLAFFLPWVRM